MSRTDLADALDPSLWDDIEEDIGSSDPKNLMRVNNRATFARARWVPGNQPAFIKCLWPSDEHAGPHTRVLTDPRRLAYLHQRISKAVALTGIPLVRHFTVDLAASGALILGMHRLSTVAAEIAGGRAGRTLALRLLSQLDCGVVADHFWYHLDVCPANIGIDSSGMPWLIDPESLQLQQLTEPFEPDEVRAWKSARVPIRIREKIDLPTAGRDAFSEKHRFEVLLAAAECCLGFIDPASDQALGTDAPPDRWLARWLAEKNGRHTELAQFWSKWLVRAMNGEESPFSEIRSDLAALSSNTELAFADTELQLDASAKLDLTELASRMRADRLGRIELLAYRDALLLEANDSPSAQVWRELVYLASCYLRDDHLAYSYVQRGLTSFGTDLTLRDLSERLRILSGAQQ